MKISFSFSSRDIFLRMRVFFSFVRLIRLALVIMALLLVFALLFDIFVFYRYSYRVVNLKPEPAMRPVRIDRAGLREALEVLDARAEKFGELYGSGITAKK